ncbi:50S ribosomal protein L11 methyltransferase [Dactylosporangium sp. CA-092794]|uniref:50S ribosomal protein L11 methyltransferase n=1 Tax=Dactylosporangium sp. CA-092794 TaxID=3239929 RepID=UPI003D8AE7E9
MTVAVGGQRIFVRTVPAQERPFVLFPSVGEYPVYDDAVYDAFDAPDRRMHAYRSAIAAAAPGRTVLDIGTGRDALWAVAAARAGARHVYAIEAQPGAAAQARRAVAGHGLTGRITVIEARSTAVRLPEPAQVCVSEIIGNVASAEGVIAALADARRRLCAPDCVWIPARAQTWVAAVSWPASSAAGEPDHAVAAESLPYLRRIFESVGHPFDLRLCLAGPVADLRISSAAAVESLTFGNAGEPPPANARGTTGLTIDAGRARLTGLVLWTRVAVSPGTAQIDALTGDTRGWAPVYAPLSLTGLPVRRGDRLRVTFERRTSDDGVHPDYRLTVALPDDPGTEALSWTSPHHGHEFRRTPLYRHLFPQPRP